MIGERGFDSNGGTLELIDVIFTSSEAIRTSPSSKLCSRSAMRWKESVTVL